MIDAILSKTPKGLRTAMSGCPGMTDQQKAFLLSVDGRTTSRELLKKIGLPDDARTGALLTSLVDGGYLRLWQSVDTNVEKDSTTELDVPEDPLDLDFTGTSTNVTANQA